MRAKSARIIFGTLAGLLAVWGVVRLLGGRDGRAAGAGLDVGAAVDTGTSVVRVLDPKGDSLRLERAGAEWRVNGWPADTGEARSLLEALDTARAVDLVSRSEANHARLGVADTSARRVEIGAPEAPAATFLVGNAGRGGRFVRAPGQREVYLLPGGVGQLLLRDADELRDRVIVALDTAVVREVVIRRGEEELIVSRPDSVWSFDGGPADTTRLADLLGSLQRLTAARFPPDSVVLETDFDAPDAVVEAYAEAGAAGSAAPLASLLFVAQEEGGDYLVRRADRPEAYVVAGWSAERLLPEAEELRP